MKTYIIDRDKYPEIWLAIKERVWELYPDYKNGENSSNNRNENCFRISFDEIGKISYGYAQVKMNTQ